MTEDCSYSHTSDEQHNAPGYVGVPLPGVQVQLEPDEGEILIKSPGQCIGYYKQPGADAPSRSRRTASSAPATSANDARTACSRSPAAPRNCSRPRKGKYVAPAPIENRINAHPMVELSLVSGVGQPAAYAMVLLAEHLRPRMAEAARPRAGRARVRSIC